MASSGYRRLLKSAKELFKADNYALRSAKSELRSQFYKNKDIKDPIELKAMLDGIDEVDEMLKFNIVQGKKNDRGNFEVKLSQDHQITVEAAQNKPLGQELEHIDQSILGKGVKVEKSNKKLK